MPRTEAANQKLREAQRTKILDAARQVFARKGMAATMTDIAEAAEVSQGLAYRYFASKEVIVSELLHRTTEAGVPEFQDFMTMPGTPGERLRRLLALIFRYGPERLEYYQVFIQALEDKTLPPDQRELMLRRGLGFQSLIRQLIIDAQASGEVAPGDPEQYVILLIALFDGLSRQTLRGAERLKDHYPDVDIILKMLKP
ncbi:MAG TPA: TetR/AcrR family transcriptional regulator [Phototrophicaceae bacterium]|nr:TetR/AcrR family transcriptional regulator [Phototrophicaceae bacterium]